ncbi:hypothetical protein DTO027B5_1019 [Paecilomyces variotii]|nr:hypothetical protein DTO212C5_8059 [Paecilomyces variotii]KAJ9326785.1 hypothetical protein DTO027B3_2446 [Paecilomyces variotii]KAJ9337221.1 hypothetical protein DTO027B5_1019 [Paecilomyces variotii]
MKYYSIFAIPIVRNQLIANTVLVVLASALVILRFVSRKLRRTNIWWDDVCIVGSLIHTYGMLGMHYQYAHVGMRRHVGEIPTENTIYIFKELVAYQIVYYNTMVLAKFSYLFFYLRIFVSRSFRLAAWACMACAAAYWLGSMLQVFLLCHPFAANWNQSIPGAHCASQNVAFSTIGAFNLVTDLMIIVLPLHFIRKLHMSRIMRVGLSAIFCVGFFISAITIIRIRVLTTVNFTDLPYSMIWAAFWSVTEPALAVANACVPMIGPVLRVAFPRWFSSRGAYVSNSAQPHSSAFKNSQRFRDGEYPLTRMDEGVTTIDVSAAGHKLEDDSNSANYKDHPEREPYDIIETSGINMRQEWSVTRQK